MKPPVYIFLLCLLLLNGISAQKNLDKFIKTHQIDLCAATQKKDSVSIIGRIRLLNQYISQHKNFDPYAYYLIGLEYFKIYSCNDTSYTFPYFRLYVNHPKSKNKAASGWWNMALCYSLPPLNDCLHANQCLDKWNDLVKGKKDEEQLKDEERMRKRCAEKK